MVINEIQSAGKLTSHLIYHVLVGCESFSPTAPNPESFPYIRSRLLKPIPVDWGRCIDKIYDQQQGDNQLPHVAPYPFSPEFVRAAGR